MGPRALWRRRAHFCCASCCCRRADDHVRHVDVFAKPDASREGRGWLEALLTVTVESGHRWCQGVNSDIRAVRSRTNRHAAHVCCQLLLLFAGPYPWPRPHATNGSVTSMGVGVGRRIGVRVLRMRIQLERKKSRFTRAASRPLPPRVWASAASFSFCFRVGLAWGLAWRAGQYQAARAWRHPPSSRPAARVSGPRARARVSCKRRSRTAPRRLAQGLLSARHRGDQCHAPQPPTARRRTSVS